MSYGTYRNQDHSKPKDHQPIPWRIRLAEKRRKAREAEERASSEQQCPSEESDSGS
jgi:hypothetical protein